MVSVCPVSSHVFRPDKIDLEDLLPDLSGFPVVWHDPADAVATLDVLLSAIAATDLETVGGRTPRRSRNAWRPSARPCTRPPPARRGSTSSLRDRCPGQDLVVSPYGAVSANLDIDGPELHGE